MLNTSDKIIKHKVGLLNLAEELGNVAKACQVMGLSRDTFYRYKEAVAEGGAEALFDQNRRKPDIKNRVDERIEQEVTEYAIAFPAHGQHRDSNALRKRGTFVSGSGVRSIWVRNPLANFKQRLKALEMWVVFINKRLLTRIVKLLLPSFIRPRHRSQQQMCSRTKCCRSLSKMLRNYVRSIG